MGSLAMNLQSACLAALHARYRPDLFCLSGKLCFAVAAGDLLQQNSRCDSFCSCRRNICNPQRHRQSSVQQQQQLDRESQHHWCIWKTLSIVIDSRTDSLSGTDASSSSCCEWYRRCWQPLNQQRRSTSTCKINNCSSTDTQLCSIGFA